MFVITKKYIRVAYFVVNLCIVSHSHDSEQAFHISHFVTKFKLSDIGTKILK